MRHIRQLPEDVINRIAAGEVVERPYSVVRELVDNSLDAGAQSIVVELDRGGHDRICVQDDGSGIPHAEVLQAFDRHATSKIATSEELERLSTYGFRGEALAAIASVSRVEILTRIESETSGIELHLDGGKLRQQRLVAFGRGTRISVTSLFFNTPARRKFLGSERGEVQKIKQWIRSFSLANPNTRFELIVDGKRKLLLPPRTNAGERALEMVQGGVSFLQEVVHDASSTPFVFSGRLAHPAMAKNTSGGVIILVNGRLITDKMIVRAVKDGFGGTLKPNEYPQGYLDIRMPPELVDVNVHPQKLEVRFWNSSEMFRLVHRVVREAVQEFRGPAVMQQRSPQFVDGDRRGAPVSPAFRPTFTFSPTENSAPPSLSLVARTHASDEQISFDGSNAVDLGAGSINVVELEEESPKINSPKIIGEIPFQYSSLRYLGKVLGCYLVCEFEEQLILVDMHAAHERVNYNKILAKLEGIGSQMRDRLLIPIAIQFEDEDEAEVFESYITDLEGVGFQIVRDESGSFHVHEKPTWMPISHVERALRAFSAVEEGGSMREAGLLRSREQIAARLSCHASIRSGDAVSREEVYALFAALDEASWSGACPHGRPVSITFGRNDIERIFGRTK